MALPTNRVTGGPVEAADINAIAAQSNANEAALAGKAAASHTHTAEQITGLPAVTDASTTTKGIVELATNAETTTGTDTTRAVTPAGVKAVVDALPAPGAGSWDDLTGKPATFPPAPHDHDGTYVKPADLPAVPTWGTISGKPAVIAAGTSQTAARAAIGAGTSNLAVGTGATDAKAGNYTPSVADVPAGSTLTVTYSGGWPARPTPRTDVVVLWVGGPVASPPAGAITADIHWPDAE